MQVKLFEVLDRGTFLPMIAIKLGSTNEAERYLLSRAGYGRTNSNHEQYVLLAGLDGGKITYDQYDWGSRTRSNAHDYIITHFDELQSGEVIDVEFILQETIEKKQSEAQTSEYI